MSRDDVDSVDTRAEVAANFFETGERSADDGRRARASRDHLGRTQPRSGTRRRGLLVVTLLSAALAFGGMTLFPPGSPTEQILLALGFGGAFLSLFAFVMAPDAQDGREAGLFARQAHNQAAVAAALDLSSVHEYVPTGHENPPVRLFVPRTVGQRIPSSEELSRTFVGDPAAGELEGLALDPTGMALLEVDAEGAFPSSSTQLVEHLCSVLLDRYELAADIRPNVDAVTGRATVTFTDPAYGHVEQFDHPLRSYIAVGIAIGLNTAVTVETVESSGEQRVRYLWNAN